MPTEDAADVIDACHERETASGFELLSDQEKVIVLASAIDFEVMLGGMHGYFFNSAGNRAQEALDALNVIGATHAASALREALAEFPDAGRARDREYRQNYISRNETHLSVYALRFDDQTPSVRELLEQYATHWHNSIGRDQIVRRDSESSPDT